MPIRRTAIGCLVGVGVLVGLMLLVRPLIFSVAPPRDDAGVILGPVSAFTNEPQRVDVVLSRSYGLDGERPLDAGRVQLAVIAWTAPPGGASVVSAASPVDPACPIEIGADRLTDCAGRAWTFDGAPIDPSLPPLQRFRAQVEAGALSADLTRPLERPGG